LTNSKIDALVAKITSKDYKDVDELAKDFSDGLASIARQPGIERGLNDNTIADVQGGTSLGVGDPSAGHISDYLVQNPQPGVANNVGSGLQTRRQTRIETDTKTLPAIVMVDAVAGDTTVRVKVAGDGVTKATDGTTGIEVVGNLTVGDGTEYDASITGQPIVNDGETGIQPIAAGRTVNIVLAKQYEVTSTNTKRFRKNVPVVQRVLKSCTACLVNGFACKGVLCVPFLQEASQFVFTDQFYPDGSDWVVDGPGLGNTSAAGRPWAVFEIGTSVVDGVLDRNLGQITYYDYGVVDGSGNITFTGIPWSVPSSANHYSEVFLDPNAQIYFYFLVIGCANGQSVTFGDVSISASYSSQSGSWTVIDSDFPVPL